MNESEAAVGATAPNRRDCDVVIIGGGPAGTTAATLLARRGWSVTLLEKDRHPRFHIGESLLPMNLPLLDELGVLTAVHGIGVHKAGADFTGAGRQDYHAFVFASALGTSPDHAFQVTRSEFDALLLENCRNAGATALESHRVRRARLGGDSHEIDGEGPAGLATWRCRYLIDASGQDGVLARQQGWRRRDRRHSAAAFFAHYRGVPAREGSKAGNLSVYRFDHGWIWMIPLRDGITSVGAVCASHLVRERRAALQAEARDRGNDAAHFLDQVLTGCPAAAARLAGAERATPVRSAANYSYDSSRQTGPGFALVGDAFSFVDPVFSSGVYLAMCGARTIVPAVEHWLAGRKLRYRWSALVHRRRMRRGTRAFKWFIHRFTTPAMDWLFENPRNVFSLERAVVSLLAGDVWDSPAIRVRLVMFKGLYMLVATIQRLAPGLLSAAGAQADPSTTGTRLGRP